MVDSLIVLAVVALDRGVGVVFRDALRAVFRKAELALGVLSVPLVEPVVYLVARAHVPAVVVVVADDIGDVVER